MCHSHRAVDILFRDIRRLFEQSNYGVSEHIDLLIFILYSFFAGKLNNFGQMLTLADPAVRDKLKAVAYAPDGRGGGEFRELIDADIKAYADVVRAANLKFD
jgi:hypothetical protein